MPPPPKMKHEPEDDGYTPPKMKREPDDDGYTAAAKRVRKQVEKGTEEYLMKRERNNEAVKKSRERSRARAKETQLKVQHLKNENAHLEQKVELLQKELSVLKDLFLAHAGSVRQSDCESPGINGGGPDTKMGTNYNSGTSGGNGIGIKAGIMVNQRAVKNDHEYTATIMS